MDWEKKTVARPALKEAASDVFNDTKTPGQALLTALQAAETVRKERYGATVAAKMKAAREYLPALEVRHPPRSDATIFGRPGAEVAALLPAGGAGPAGGGAAAPAVAAALSNSLLRGGKVSLEHVQAMIEGQMERHNQAWEAFTAARDAARSALEACVAGAAASFQQRLAADDAGVAEDLAALDDDRVMRLTEQEIYQVWDCVAQRIPQRARWIEECAAALEAAEEQRRETVESALVSLCAGLNDAAVVSEGEVERQVEREAMALNVAILENRRAYADLVSRLQVAEVEAERSRRAAWQDGLRRWRVLRTQHAINTFVERIRSPEFSEPAERLAAFAGVRERQAAALAALGQHWGRAGSLTPPHLSAKKVAAWAAEAGALEEAWAKERQQLLAALRAAEDALAGRVGELLEALRQEVGGYRGYPPEQLEELVAQQAGRAVEERRQAALTLLQQAEAFLAGQAAQWSATSSALAAWLGRLCAMHDAHRTQTASDQSAVRGALKSSREAFNAADAAREAALEAAVAAVSHGSGEADLDAAVAVALRRLDEIEAGYRSFHRDMTARSRAYPGAVRSANDAYHVGLCAELGVQPQTQAQWLGPGPAAGGGGGGGSGGGGGGGGQGAQGGAGAGAGSEGSSRASTAQEAAAEAPQPKILGTIKLPDGRSFALIVDMLRQLITKPAAKAAVRSRAASEAGDPAAAPAAEAAAPVEAPAAPADGAAAAEGTEPAPAVEAESSDAIEARAALPGPLSSGGAPLCRTLPLPADTLRRTLESIQSGLLSDMMTFCQRALEAAEAWAAEREVSLTEELDGWLRHHRPRAGRIEEEVRTSRSVELVAQRRRVERHLANQSKAVRAQAAAFEEGLGALEAEVRKAVVRLRATEGFLAHCLSSKAIGIRQREAEALRARLDKDLTSKLAELSERTKAATAKIIETNRKFEADELRTFSDGGKYSDANAAAYRRSTAAIDAHLERVAAEQAQRLEASRAALSSEADAALAHVVSLVPSHVEDMELIERMDGLVQGARKRAAGELERNKAAAAAITSQLDLLDRLLDGRKDSQPTAKGANGRAATANGGLTATGRLGTAGRSRPGTAIAAAATRAGLPSQPNRSASGAVDGAAGGGAAADDVPAAPLDRCRAILECTDSLRKALLRQSKVLDFLHSASLSAPPVDLRIDAAGVDPPPPPFVAAASATPAAPAAAAAAAAASKPGSRDAAKRPAGSALGARAAPAATPAAAAAAAAAQEVVVKLATDVEAVIDACKKETEAVAKAYYAAKDKSRPIRYPARIPATVEELLRGTDAVLEGLREQTLSYVTEAVRTLRTQVIRAYRSLERLPSVALALLADHEAAALAEAHAGLAGGLAARRGALSKLVDVHRGSLQPGMMMPARRHELAAVRASESDRAAAHASLLSGYGGQAVELARKQAPALQSRLVRLAAQLAALLDSFLLPQDLPPPGPGEDWVYDLPHKDTKQLMRLAAAQAEAEATPPPPPPVDPKAAKAAAQAAQAAAAAAAKGGKDAKGGKGGKDAKAAAPEPPPPPPPPPPERPYGPGQWSLPSGNFDLVSLGWLDEAGRPPPGAPEPPRPETPPPQQAAPAAKAVKPLLGGKQAPPPPPKAEVPPGRAPLVPEPAPLSALDTPCHRCVVRAYRAAVQRVESSLRSAMTDHRERLSSWAKDEELWGRTWAALVRRLEGM